MRLHILPTDLRLLPNFLAGIITSCAILAAPNPCHAQAKNLKDAITQADSLLTGSKDDLTGYHLHYDLTETSMTGETTTGTYDVWFVDPKHNRTQLVMEPYFWDSTLNDSALVRHSGGQESLRVHEFNWLWPRPESVIDDLSRQHGIQNLMKRSNRAGPQLCAISTYSELCFDKDRGNYARARMGYLTAIYGNWRPIGTRFFPTDISLFHKKAEIFHAIGSIEPFKDTTGILDVNKHTYPAPDAPFGPYPRLIQESASQIDSIGYALVKVWVDDEGKPTKYLLLDADEKSIADAAARSVRTLKFVPTRVDGRPVPSETTYLYRSRGGH